MDLLLGAGLAGIDIGQDFAPLLILGFNRARQRDNTLFELNGLRRDLGLKRVAQLGECFHLHLRFVAFVERVLDQVTPAEQAAIR